MASAFATSFGLSGTWRLLPTTPSPQLNSLQSDAKLEPKAVPANNRKARWRCSLGSRPFSASNALYDGSTKQLTPDQEQMNPSVRNFGEVVSPLSLPLLDAFVGHSFASTVVGEWFGYEVAFSVCDGAALLVDERYIPDAFRAWGVPVKGFETVTSTRVNEGKLYVKRTRALPAVGCEADAVATEIAVEEWSAYEPIGSASVPFYGLGFDDGGFFRGPGKISENSREPWSICIVDPRSSVLPTPRRLRLRLGQKIHGKGTVIVIVETWDAPFCDGALLPGCGGKNASFADEPRAVPGQDIKGRWLVNSMEYTLEKQSNMWSVARKTFTLERSADAAEMESSVALPLGITVGLTASSEERDTSLFVGWLTSKDLRTTLKADFDEGGELMRVTKHTEELLL